MNPFDALPDRQIWSRAFASGTKPGEIGIYTTPLIRKGGAVATIGTALAAQLATALGANGFASVRTEERHPAFADIPPETEDYETFSAGYGEVHSARELLQLVQRCTRTFAPKDDRWREGDRIVDPFRPGLIYAARSDREFDLLTEKHLNAVRSAFRRCETLIVALSASEVCESIVDGAVFPVWPGTVAGAFDPERHAFRTLTIEDTNADLRAAIAELRTINPAMSIILMVSPEPMEATAMPAHVAAESLYGKAILRVAMDLASYEPGVSYFPAWEIVATMGAAAFGDDGRTLNPGAIGAVTSALLDVSEGGSIAMTAPERTAPSSATEAKADTTTPPNQAGAKPEPARQRQDRKPGIELKVVDEYSIALESQKRHQPLGGKGPRNPRKAKPDREQREQKPRKEPKPKSRKAREAAAASAGLAPTAPSLPDTKPKTRGRRARESATAGEARRDLVIANQTTGGSVARITQAKPRMTRVPASGKTAKTSPVTSAGGARRSLKDFATATGNTAKSAEENPKRARKRQEGDDGRRWWENEPKS